LCKKKEGGYPLGKIFGGNQIPMERRIPQKVLTTSLEEAYHEWGMKGFKLHAGVGYMPDDPVVYWVYEKAAEWKIPVLAHTGGIPSAILRWENSRPAYFATAAARFPEVNFIFAHAGDVG